MKKIIIAFLSSLIFIPIFVNAASGNISISSTSNVVVGNKITVTVTLSSSTAIGSWEMQLNYDKNYLSLTSSTAENGGNYMVGYTTSAKGTKSKTYTFTFKTLKAGSTKLSIGGYDVYANDMSSMSINASSKTIKIITQAELEESYSKNNYLKSLNVEGYDLDKEFNKDTLEYNINVPEGTNSIHISATPEDSKSHITGVGDIEVTEGINNLKIVVRAENGSEKIYSIVVNVIDQNPINVVVNNTDYSIIKLRNNYICPDTFIESEIEINGIKVPACFNSKINYTLVGLKNSEGEIFNYIYNNGEYQKYIETIGTSLKLIILDNDNELDGLTKYIADIDGINYNVYKVSENSKSYIVYGLNIETGEKDFYSYDTINKTFSLYDTELQDKLINLNKTYLYVIIAFGVGLFLSLICMISLCFKKKNKKAIMLENNILNEKKEIKDEQKEKISKKEELKADSLNQKKSNKKEKNKSQFNAQNEKQKNMTKGRNKKK